MSQSDLSSGAWYDNTGLVEGDGVNYDNTAWDAPYIEDTKICFPHLYSEYDTGTSTGTYLSN